MLLRARKWPATGSTNRTKCSKMGQLAPSFQFLISLHVSPFSHVCNSQPAPPALPAGSPLFTSGVRYSASPSSSSTACWIAPRSIFRFGPASAPGIRQWDSRSRYLWAWAVDPSGDCRRRVSGRIPHYHQTSAAFRFYLPIRFFPSSMERKSLSAAEIDRQISHSLHQRCNHPFGCIPELPPLRCRRRNGRSCLEWGNSPLTIMRRPRSTGGSVTPSRSRVLNLSCSNSFSRGAGVTSVFAGAEESPPAAKRSA